MSLEQDRSAVPVSVIVPTVGREGLLDATLSSLAACVPAAAEVLLVDQSETGAASRAVARTGVPARVVEMPRTGIAAGMNVGLRQAQHDAVLVTHDDCHVAPDWVGVARDLLGSDPDALWTGRVLADVGPDQDPENVPSTIDELDPYTYDRVVYAYALFPANMAVDRRAVLELGGFDERFTTAGEDNDLCLRWLSSGRRLRYTPELVVWHSDWRTPDELRALYRRYAFAQGLLFAKWLRLRPWLGLRLVAEEYRQIVGAVPRRIRDRGSDRVDPTYSAFMGIPVGLARSWRKMSPGRRAP